MISSIIENVFVQDNYVQVSFRHSEGNLSLGHEFSEIAILEMYENGKGMPIIAKIIPIKLIVSNIRWYGRSIPTVEPGMTGYFTLNGTANDELMRAFLEIKDQPRYLMELRSYEERDK